MSDDWQPGDLAFRVGRQRVCDGCGHKTPHAPGTVHVVSRAGVDDYYEVGELPRRLPYLHFVGEPETVIFTSYWGGECEHSGYNPADYVKPRPHKADEEDRETIRLLTTQPEPAEA